MKKIKDTIYMIIRMVKRDNEKWDKMNTMYKYLWRQDIKEKDLSHLAKGLLTKNDLMFYRDKNLHTMKNVPVIDSN